MDMNEHIAGAMDVSGILQTAAMKAAKAGDTDHLIKIINKACADAKAVAYEKSEKSCLSCQHFDREGDLMSGYCATKIDHFTHDRLYVSQSDGKKCKQYKTEDDLR